MKKEDSRAAKEGQRNAKFSPFNDEKIDRSAGQAGLASKRHRLSYWVIVKLGLRKRVESDRRREDIERLYLTKQKQAVYDHWYKKIENAAKTAGVCFFLGLGLILYERAASIEGVKDQRLDRPEDGAAVKNYTLLAEADSGEKEEITIAVGRKEYTKEQWQTAVKEAVNELSGSFLGKNKSKDAVVQKLELPERLMGRPITVEWSFRPFGYIDQDGTVHNEELEEPVEIKVQGTLRCQNWEESFEENIQVLPKPLTARETFWKQVKKEAETAEQTTRVKEYLTLPRQVKGKQLRYSQPLSYDGLYIMILGGILAVLMFFQPDQELDRLEKRRKEEIDMAYPILMNKLILLMGAGMTIKTAWEKLARDYQEKKKMGASRMYAYEEMTITWHEISNGISERTAYEAFGKRMGTTAYLRFSTLLTQNLRKGSRGLLELLEVEAVQAWENRKELAKRKGEEAGTKLLLPMMVMFLMVMLIIMIPAFDSL